MDIGNGIIMMVNCEKMNSMPSKNQYNLEGERHGYWEEYWCNGKLQLKGNYINGKRDGYWEYYYDNGNLWGKGHFINDNPDGYFEWCNFDGTLEGMNFYVN